MTFGFQLRTKPTVGRKRDLVENIRALLLPRSDGTPGMLVSPGPSAEMRYVREGFLGGYHYPELTLGRADRCCPPRTVSMTIFSTRRSTRSITSPMRGAMVEEIGQGADWWKGAEAADNPWPGRGNRCQSQRARSRRQSTSSGFDGICMKHNRRCSSQTLRGEGMPASFLELHKITKKITKALEPLDETDRDKVIAAVLALYGQK